MDVLFWFFLPVLIGPILVGLGVWCAFRMRRALRQRPRATGAAAGFGVAALVSILAGLGLTAQVLLLLLYAWNHHPPSYDVIEETTPAPVAAVD